MSDINLPTETAKPAMVTVDETHQPNGDPADNEANPLNSAEHQVLIASLSAHSWNISRTAVALDMSRNTLYRKMRKHHISPNRN